MTEDRRRITFMDYARECGELIELLADRLYRYAPAGEQQPEDIVLFAKAREHGWKPWHERETPSPNVDSLQ